MEQLTAKAASVWEIDADERDALVRHARSVIRTAADQMMTRDDDQSLKDGSKHIAVMVAVLDQIGWQEGKTGTVALLDDLLPIEQIRVWVEDRFLAWDLDALNEGVKLQREDFERVLSNHTATCRLLYNLTLRAARLGRGPGGMWTAETAKDALKRFEQRSAA